jgi:hypothetical protein
MPFDKTSTTPPHTFYTPSSVSEDTGLDEHEQRQRETIVKLWVWRLNWLEATTGCSLADAIRATALTDEEVPL